MKLYDFADVLNFWFNELTPQQWFAKSDALDETIKHRFGATLKAASLGELWQWRESAKGRLAEIIVLDQFSRNVYRDRPASFAQDAMALVLAQEAVALKVRSEEHTSELQSRENLVCRLLLEKKNGIGQVELK